MAVAPISSVTPLNLPTPAPTVSATSNPAASSFAERLHDALSQVAGTQQQADAGALRLAAGDLENLHQAALQMEEAKLTFQLALQVRNKIVEAYQEVSRMQV
jgi:flagellar hook-basal body complex protein FliE